jgi:hypothetical protein
MGNHFGQLLAPCSTLYDVPLYQVTCLALRPNVILKHDHTMRGCHGDFSLRSAQGSQAALLGTQNLGLRMSVVNLGPVLNPGPERLGI